MKNLTYTTAMGKLVYTLTYNGNEYGVKVNCSLFGDTETAEIENITPDRKKALALLSLLADNAALASTLKDVVEDWVCAEYLLLCQEKSQNKQTKNQLTRRESAEREKWYKFSKSSGER